MGDERKVRNTNKRDALLAELRAKLLRLAPEPGLKDQVDGNVFYMKSLAEMTDEPIIEEMIDFVDSEECKDISDVTRYTLAILYDVDPPQPRYPQDNPNWKPRGKR